MAATYLCNFFLILLVGVMEFVAWLLSIFGSHGFALFFSPIIAFYGVIFAYVFPVVLAFQGMGQPVVNGGLNKDSDAVDYANYMMLFTVGWLHWMMSTIIHIMYSARFVAHAQAMSD